MLFAQLDLRAFSLARAKTGNKMAASNTMIVMTTSSSIRVKRASHEQNLYNDAV